MTDLSTTLIALDLGSTHLKAGLFNSGGDLLCQVNREICAQPSPEGALYYDPVEMWNAAAALLKELAAHPGSDRSVGIGIAGMAETGLLIDRANDQPRSPMIPWFDTSASPQSARLQSTAAERFLIGGVQPTYKCPLIKVLWLRQAMGIDPSGCCWLNAVDFIAYRLCGALATDHSLASRTYAFDIYRRRWDTAWIESLDLPANLFPPALPSGSRLGALLPHISRDLGLPAVAVCIAGHDHFCGAGAVGAVEPGTVYDSMGTAEAFCGAIPSRPLTAAHSGFSIGCHTVPGRFYWVGGLSSAGGSIEWLRRLIPGLPLDYESIESLLADTAAGPGGLLFFPYLAGAGSPHSAPDVRAAFVGLESAHNLADLLKAAVEGACYEVEWMRRSAEDAFGFPIRRVIASGGGVRMACWMQTKADVTGCEYEVAGTPEATLLGAALQAGVMAGLYPSMEEASAQVRHASRVVYRPDPARQARYNRVFEQDYLPFQEPLRRFYARRSR